MLKALEGTLPAPVETLPQQRAGEPSAGELQQCQARRSREGTTTPEAPFLASLGEDGAGGWASLTLPGAFTAQGGSYCSTSEAGTSKRRLAPSNMCLCVKQRCRCFQQIPWDLRE